VTGCRSRVQNALDEALFEFADGFVKKIPRSTI